MPKNNFLQGTCSPLQEIFLSMSLRSYPVILTVKTVHICHIYMVGLFALNLQPAVWQFIIFSIILWQRICLLYSRVIFFELLQKSHGSCKSPQTTYLSWRLFIQRKWVLSFIKSPITVLAARICADKISLINTMQKCRVCAKKSVNPTHNNSVDLKLFGPKELPLFCRSVLWCFQNIGMTT